MLKILEKALQDLPYLMTFQKTEWESLVINRRKPYTYRAFIKTGDYRICLHRFESCDEHEAFPHPHAWPMACKILKGSYNMQFGVSEDRTSKPKTLGQLVFNAGSSYEMTDPMTWHTVVPNEECYTVMVNAPPWPKTDSHEEIRTTKGKDLEKMTTEELEAHFAMFRSLLPPCPIVDAWNDVCEKQSTATVEELIVLDKRVHDLIKKIK